MFPTPSSMTASGVTEGDFKARLTELIEALTLLFGNGSNVQVALGALGAPLNGTLTKSAAYTVLTADRGKLIDCTGTWTLAIGDAAALGSGFAFAVRNSGTGTITVNPYLTQTVDGVTTITIGAGESTFLLCDGTGWRTVSRQVFQPPTTNVILSQQLVTSGSGTLTKPTDATKVLVEVQGGGGLGPNNNGGAYSSKIFDAANISYTIGTSGTTSATVDGVSITAGGSGGSASGGDINVSGRSSWGPTNDNTGSFGGQGYLLNYGSGYSSTYIFSGGSNYTQVTINQTPGAMRVTWYK